MDNDHRDSFGDFLGGLFQLFLLGFVIYVLFLIILGIFKLIWWLLGCIWKLITWLWSQVKKRVVLRYWMNKLAIVVHTFLLKHKRLNRSLLRIRSDAIILYTSRPTELFGRLKKSFGLNA